jgi:hypothetical protein
MRILFIVLIFIPSLALAYPVDSSIGFGSGYTWTEATFDEPITSIGDTTQTPSYSSVDNSNLPWDLFASFRFHKNYGIEFGYIDYGTIKFDRTFTTETGGEFESSSVRKASISTQGFYISHVLYLPIIQHLDFQAKAGLFFGTNDYKDTEELTTISDGEPVTDPSLTNASRSISEPQFAIGLLYQYQPDWRLRLQLNQIEYDHIEEKETFSQWFTSFSFEREF